MLAKYASDRWGVVLAILSSALLGACTSGEQDARASENTGKQDKELTVLLTGVSGAWPSGVDPATSATSGVNLSIMNAVFGGLFQLTADEDGSNPRITGVLASGYEFGDDGRSLVIRLREGLRFSDGTPLDAEAVRFNVQRAIESPCVCAPTRWPWAKPEPVSVLDKLTVRLNFTRPYAAAINTLPVSNVNWIASPSALTAMGVEAFKLKPVGAGPFKIVSNQLSTRIELERNPDYWEHGHPYLDRLVFVPIGSEQAAYLSLIAGDADVAEGISSVPLIQQAQREGKVEARRQPADSPYVIQLNTSAAPFNDMRAREAIYYATNVEAIANALFHGWSSASQSFTGPGGLFHRERVPGYREYDPARARALVAELGGLKVKLTTVGSVVNEQLITALQSQWQEVGMDVSIEMYELATLVRGFQSGQWQAMLQTAGSYDPEASPGVSFRFRSDQVFSGVHDPDLDRMLFEAAAEVDPQRREELYTAAGKYISDRAYAPFLFAFAPAALTRHGIEGPGLSTEIPPVALSTAVLWQDVRVSAE